jgi:hypothetical protein
MNFCITRGQFLSICFLGSVLASLFTFNILNAQVGQIIEAMGVKDPTYKSNQSQVVWYDGFWWGVFKKSGGGTYVYKYNGSSWLEDVYTGISSGDAVDIYMDEDNNKLYVLVSTTAALSRLSYSGGNFTLDTPTFPVSVNINPPPGNSKDDPACITQSQNGHIFIFWANSTNLMGLRSTTEGVTWSSPFSIMATTDASALTDAISFQYGGNNYVGVCIGEGGGAFHFWRLIDGGDLTSNWYEESLPSISGSADDHVNIVKDASNNLYMIGKNGDNNNFFLFKRHSDGSWENSYKIQPSYGTRPALAIDETYNSLIILATVARSGDSSTKIQYTVLDKDNLSDVIGDNSWTPVLENGNDVFTDVTVSYQILDDNSNLMVCATNMTTGEVWYNVLGMSDIALPVFMAFFNATSTADGINLDWATHSEVSNWEWIVYRKEGGKSAFQEIARLPGAGTTNTTAYYHYSDINVDPGKIYYYRIASEDFDGTVHNYPQVTKSTLISSVTSFALYPNYPNPFNNQTTIRFDIGESANTIVDIFDVSGRRVRRLVEGELKPGSYNYNWNGQDEHHNDVSSGVYLVTLSSKNYFRAIKLVLSR